MYIFIKLNRADKNKLGHKMLNHSQPLKPCTAAQQQALGCSPPLSCQTGGGEEGVIPWWPWSTQELLKEVGERQWIQLQVQQGNWGWGGVWELGSQHIRDRLQGAAGSKGSSIAELVAKSSGTAIDTPWEAFIIRGQNCRTGIGIEGRLQAFGTDNQRLVRLGCLMAWCCRSSTDRNNLNNGSQHWDMVVCFVPVWWSALTVQWPTESARVLWINFFCPLLKSFAHFSNILPSWGLILPI